MLRQAGQDFNVIFTYSWFIDNTLIAIQTEFIIMSYITMKQDIQKKHIRDYVNREIEVIKRLNIDAIHPAVHAIWEAYEREATIFIFGNGGSVATASHFVFDFNKGISENENKLPGCKHSTVR